MICISINSRLTLKLFKKVNSIFFLKHFLLFFYPVDLTCAKKHDLLFIFSVHKMLQSEIRSKGGIARGQSALNASSRGELRPTLRGRIQNFSDCTGALIFLFKLDIRILERSKVFLTVKNYLKVFETVYCL